MAEPTPPAPAGLSFASFVTKTSPATRPQSIAVIGKSKAGKTTLGASASNIAAMVAAGKSVLIIDAEGGTSGVGSMYPGVDVIKVGNIEAFEQVFEELLTRPHNYGAFVIDTFDKIQAWKSESLSVTYGTDTFGRFRRLKHWSMEMIAQRLHDSPYLGIFLFHEEDEKDAATGVIERTFKLQGSSQDEIGQVFDIISHLSVGVNAETGEPVRILQLGPQVGYATGNRWEQILPNRMENADLPTIFEMILSNTPTQ